MELQLTWVSRRKNSLCESQILVNKMIRCKNFAGTIQMIYSIIIITNLEAQVNVADNCRLQID